MRKSLKKKGQGMGLSGVPGIMITLLIVVVVIFFVAKFLTQTQSTETSGTLAYNATVAGTDAVKNVTSNMGLWGLAIGIGVSIAIVLGVLYFTAGKRR